MRVGITGSSGFIGAALVRALQERGDEVVRFVRPDSPPYEGGVIRWDPPSGHVDNDDLRRIGGFDAVVNLAGAGIGDQRWTAERKDEILLSRLRSTALVVEAIKATATGTEVFASGSAIGYYGSRGGELLDEDSLPGEDFLAFVCREWEKACDPVRQLGAAVASLRTGIVMSSNGGVLKRQIPLFRFGLGGTLSNGQQWLSPISLDDEVRAILWILDHRLAGPFNLVSPTPVTNRTFTSSLGHLLHRPTLARVPARVLDLVLGAELTHGAILASQRAIPKSLTLNGFTFHHLDMNSILKAAFRSP